MYLFIYFYDTRNLIFEHDFQLITGQNANYPSIYNCRLVTVRVQNAVKTRTTMVRAD